MNILARTLSSFLLASALPATANPVTDGQQLCVMLRSGISQEMAWDYIVADHRKAALAPLQFSVPWYSASAAGWTVGTTWGRLEQSEKELAAMKPDAVAPPPC